MSLVKLLYAVFPTDLIPEMYFFCLKILSFTILLLFLGILSICHVFILIFLRIIPYLTCSINSLVPLLCSAAVPNGIVHDLFHILESVTNAGIFVVILMGSLWLYLIDRSY